MSSASFDRVVDLLTSTGHRPQRHGDGAVIARCPGHDDRSPSLSVTDGRDRVLLYCHAGCAVADIAAALGITVRDLFDEPRDTPATIAPAVTHTYRDETGRPVFVVTRRGTGDGKDIRQARVNDDGSTTPRLGDARRVLYRLPDLVAAHDTGAPVVFVVEGEKDADLLAPVVSPYPVTTSPMGAGKWRKADERARQLVATFGRVIVLADDDTPGRRHAADVADDLRTLRPDLDVRAYTVTGHHDIGDAITRGTVSDLDTLRATLTPLGTGEDTSPPGDAFAPGLVVLRADTVTPRPRAWLWEGYAPRGKLVVIDGDPGDGKSSVTLDLAARVTRGDVMPDGSPGYGHPRDVVVVSPEDDPADTVVPRLIAAGADLSRAHLVRGVAVDPDGGERGLRLDRHDVDKVAQLVDAHSVGLVILDPLFAFVPGSVDVYRDNVMREALAPLVRLAESTLCAVVVVRHNVKGTGGKAVHRGGGSVAITGAARGALLTVRDVDDPDVRLLVPGKLNVGRPGPAYRYRITTARPDITDRDHPLYGVGRVDWLGADDRAADELLRASDRGNDDDRNERDDAADELLAYLRERGGEAPIKDARDHVMRTCAVSKGTVDRARAALGLDRIDAGFGGVRMWRLPDRTSQETTVRRTPRSATYGDSLRRTDVEVEPPNLLDDVPVHACSGSSCRVPGCPHGLAS